MLGTIGFTAAALTFIAYGLIASKFKTTPKDFNLRAYEDAYYIAAIAFLTWAFATIVNTNSLTKLVYLGDILLLIAVVLLVRVVAPIKNRNLYTLLVAVLAVAGFIYRVKVGGPDPVMLNSVLVFYTPRLFGAFVALALLVLWFPANMKFYNTVVAKHTELGVLRIYYFSSNLIGFIGVCGFLFAHKYATIVFSFTILVIAVASLVGLNYAVLNPSKKEAGHAK